MRRVIISDTSCLVILEKIDTLFLLQMLFEEVYITPEVAGEYGQPLPQWVILKNPVDKNQQVILEASLDKGESNAYPGLLFTQIGTGAAVVLVTLLSAIAKN